MPLCSRFHAKFNRYSFQQGRRLLWCCLPHGEPIVLAVSTPETSLGQSQGHPRLKSFLATKSRGKAPQPLQHGSCCSTAFPGDNEQPSMGSLKQGGQNSKNAKSHYWGISLLPKHIPLNLLRRLGLKPQIHILSRSRLPQVIFFLSFSLKTSNVLFSHCNSWDSIWPGGEGPSAEEGPWEQSAWIQQPICKGVGTS